MLTPRSSGLSGVFPTNPIEPEDIAPFKRPLYNASSGTTSFILFLTPEMLAPMNGTAIFLSNIEVDIFGVL